MTVCYAIGRKREMAEGLAKGLDYGCLDICMSSEVCGLPLFGCVDTLYKIIVASCSGL